MNGFVQKILYERANCAHYKPILFWCICMSSKSVCEQLNLYIYHSEPTCVIRFYFIFIKLLNITIMCTKLCEA